MLGFGIGGLTWRGLDSATAGSWVAGLWFNRYFWLDAGTKSRLGGDLLGLGFNFELPRTDCMKRPRSLGRTMLATQDWEPLRKLWWNWKFSSP